jgi:ABC-type glutathione transport system ATPase component
VSALSLEGVRFRYSGAAVDALRDVTVTVEPGQTVAVLGESGSGKSTLALAALCLIPIAAGTIRWNGLNPWSMPGRERRRLRRGVQAVFQAPHAAFDPRWSIARSLREPFDVQSIELNEMAVKELCAEVQLSGQELLRRPNELSVGQLQRAALVRALVLGAQTLVLDEPFSALDVSIQAQLMAFLERLRQQRKLSMLVVTHDLAVARLVADSVAVLFAGRIVEMGPASAVLEAPKHPYTRALVNSQDSGSGVNAGEPGCTYRTRCPHAVRSCALQTPQLEGTPHRVACPVIGAQERVLAQSPHA